MLKQYLLNKKKAKRDKGIQLSTINLFIDDIKYELKNIITMRT